MNEPIDDRWPTEDRIQKTYAPGLVLAKDGGLHFDPLQYLPFLGLPVTLETCMWAEGLVKEIMRQQGPQIPIVDVFP
jgi:hypothetical protein